jgi:hypothetical protein
MGIPMDILIYTPEEFARYQSVPGSFTHFVAHEGKVLYAGPGEHYTGLHNSPLTASLVT